MNTLLTDVLNPIIRKYLYIVYSIAAIVIGALQIADVSTGKASDVLVYIGIALGLTAASNTRTEDGELK